MLFDVGRVNSWPRFVIATFIALSHVSFVGNPAAACKYFMARAMEGRAYTFAAVSFH